jgi:hypothetical protein
VPLRLTDKERPRFSGFEDADVGLTGSFSFVTAEPDVVLHHKTWRREQGAESLQYRLFVILRRHSTLLPAMLLRVKLRVAHGLLGRAGRARLRQGNFTCCEVRNARTMCSIHLVQYGRRKTILRHGPSLNNSAPPINSLASASGFALGHSLKHLAELAELV